MKDRKPENHSLQLDRRQLLKWLGVTGSALTLGSLLPAGAFAADDEETVSYTHLTLPTTPYV